MNISLSNIGGLLMVLGLERLDLDEQLVVDVHGIEAIVTRSTEKRLPHL